MIKFFKKYHKWLGVLVTLFIIIFALSGIVLNHRKLCSGIDVNRNILPSEYHYSNWNNAAVAGTERLDDNNIFIYGNIGVWKTDSTFSSFTDFNAGFPKGIDNRKVAKIFKNSRGDLFAGTYFGLYQFNFEEGKWAKIHIPIHEERITDVAQKGDSLLVLSRSYLLTSKDYHRFNKITLPQPENYQNKAGLFKTLWIIHSGEIYGLPGMLLVDLVGIIFIFLSITGLIYFINGYKLRGKKDKKADLSRVVKSNKWNLKWHNKIGWTTLIVLIITTITGMFLRPPLLIAIVYSQVKKIPYTILDTPNPWFDKLRRIIYDETNERYIIATLDGIYYSDDNFSSELKPFRNQPPISVMGVNAFEQMNESTLLVGSFEGMFQYNIETGAIFDHLLKRPYQRPTRSGPPIGNFPVTGYSKDFKNSEVIFDFNFGARVFDRNNKFPKMPSEIQNQSISLWNVALEFHTARMYKFMFGNFYILFIPLSGTLILFILISGFIVWYKRHRK